jgi:hypothetical protein
VRLCAGVKIDQSPDTWMCSVGEDGKYTVKSGYIFLATNFFPPSDLNDEECMVLNNMWDSYAHNFQLADAAFKATYTRKSDAQKHIISSGRSALSLVPIAGGNINASIDIYTCFCC